MQAYQPYRSHLFVDLLQSITKATYQDVRMLDPTEKAPTLLMEAGSSRCCCFPRWRKGRFQSPSVWRGSRFARTGHKRNCHLCHCCSAPHPPRGTSPCHGPPDDLLPVGYMGQGYPHRPYIRPQPSIGPETTTGEAHEGHANPPAWRAKCSKIYLETDSI
jgi:hypothetical protein